MLRVLTVGSVPPEYGGTTTGGVAKVHGLLISHWLKSTDVSNFRLAGVVAPNRPARDHTDLDDLIPFVALPEESSKQQEPYLRALHERRIDVVLFFHIGHRFADWHIKLAADVPAVGAIHSWHQVLIDDPVSRKTKVERLQLHISRMQWLTAPSQYTFEQGQALGFRYSSPYNAIYNAMDPKINDYVMSAKGCGRERQGIAFIGALIERKRPALVIQAAAALGIPLVIVGDGPQRAELECLAERVAAKATIRFEGQQPADRIADVLMSSEMLCVPSVSEGLANVYWEALICGTPIVGFAPNITELSQVLGISVGEPVSERAELDEVVHAIERVRDGLWQRDALTQMASRWTSVSVCARQYAEVISAVKSSKGSSSPDLTAQGYKRSP